MCGTMNDGAAQSCSFCGYLFENYNSPVVSDVKASETLPADPQSTVAPPIGEDIPQYTSAISSGSPLFVVSRSLVSSMAPGIAYLVFIIFISSYSALSLYSLGLIVVLLLASIVPVLFAPRKFEFYDSSLRIHKIIGKDSEYQYSELTLHDPPIRRRPQIVLSAPGQRRPIVIQGNPTNKELGIDLLQFLRSKLKKPEAAQKAGGPEKDSASA